MKSSDQNKIVQNVKHNKQLNVVFFQLLKKLNIEWISGRVDLWIYSENFMSTNVNSILIYWFLVPIFILACTVLCFLRKTSVCTRQEKQNKWKCPLFGSHEYWCTVAFWKVPQPCMLLVLRYRNLRP